MATVPAAAGLGVRVPILGSRCPSSSLPSLLELRIDLRFQLSSGCVTLPFSMSRPPKVLPLHLCSHRKQNQSHPRIQPLLRSVIRTSSLYLSVSKILSSAPVFSHPGCTQQSPDFHLPAILSTSVTVPLPLQTRQWFTGGRWRIQVWHVRL